MYSIISRLALSEEDGCDGDGCDDAAEVSKETGCDGVARLADTNGTEIDGEDVEGGVGCPLEDARQAANEGIGAVLIHRIDHHAACSAAGEGLHDSCGKRCYIVGVAAKHFDKPAEAVDDEVHRARSTEHTYGNKYCNEVGDDADGRLEAAFCPFHKGLIDVYLLADACRYEGDDNAEEDDVGNDGTPLVHRFLVNLCTEPYNAAYYGTKAYDETHNGTIEKVDALVQTCDDHACERGDGCCDENRDEDICRLFRTGNCPVSHYADGDERQAAGVQHEEHNHGIRRGVLLLIQFLQALHCLEAKRRRSVVKPQHIRAEVHKDMTKDGMPCRYLGEEAHHKRRQPTGKDIDKPAAFTNFHNAHPKGQHARQPDGNLESSLGIVEGAVHNGREHLGVAKAELHHSNDECDEKEAYPDVI